jgi:alkanesulfonate monooxygenase SsuD/methylene tetrahydromethanopterin reductase-like flavin-dependent oxidoreductase (luciferase family)
MQLTAKVPGLSLSPGSTRHWFEDISAPEIVSLARELEDYGVDHLTISEHIAIDRDFGKTLGARWAHSLTSAGILLGATSRVKVKCLLILPLHPPIELAKAIATLDMLSGGRLVPVFLTGYHAPEFATLGVPFEARGKIMDEYLEAMHELWYSDAPYYEGSYVRFSGIAAEPRPSAGLQLWFGAHTKVALRRVAKWGRGLSPWATTRASLPAMLDVLREGGAFRPDLPPFQLSMPLFEGEVHPDTHQVIRPPQVSLEPDDIFREARMIADLGVTVTSLDQVFGGGPYAAEAGPVTRVSNIGEYRQRLAWLANDVIPELHSIPSKSL